MPGLQVRNDLDTEKKDMQRNPNTWCSRSLSTLPVVAGSADARSNSQRLERQEYRLGALNDKDHSQFATEPVHLEINSKECVDSARYR
jgi:hypothetical protein